VRVLAEEVKTLEEINPREQRILVFSNTDARITNLQAAKSLVVDPVLPVTARRQAEPRGFSG